MLPTVDFMDQVSSKVPVSFLILLKVVRVAIELNRAIFQGFILFVVPFI